MLTFNSSLFSLLQNQVSYVSHEQTNEKPLQLYKKPACVFSGLWFPHAFICLNTGIQYDLSLLKWQLQKLPMQGCLLLNSIFPLALLASLVTDIQWLSFASTSGTVALWTLDWFYSGCYILICFFLKRLLFWFVLVFFYVVRSLLTSS